MERQVAVEVPKLVREDAFREFSEKTIDVLVGNDDELSAGRHKRVSTKLSKMTGVKSATAERYLTYLEKAGVIHFKRAGVEAIEREGDGEIDIKPKRGRRPIQSKILPRLKSNYGITPRLESGKFFPRLYDFLKPDQKWIVGISALLEKEIPKEVREEELGQYLEEEAVGGLGELKVGQLF